MSIALAALRWESSTRIVRTIYPPVDLFEDIADPADWELLVAAVAKTNPRVREQVGDLSIVPAGRRVSGVTASVVMGVFTHASPARPGRFSDGRFGVWYAGDRPEVALAETMYHYARFMRATQEGPAQADYRELTCAVAGQVFDLRADGLGCLDPDDWRPGQMLGRKVRDEGGDGVVYPSVRWPQGQAVALFWPDCVALPVREARQFRYHWNGSAVDRYFIHGTRAWLAPPG